MIIDLEFVSSDNFYSIHKIWDISTLNELSFSISEEYICKSWRKSYKWFIKTSFELNILRTICDFWNN